MRKWRWRATVASTLFVAASTGVALAMPAAAAGTPAEAPVVSFAKHPVQGSYLVTLAADRAAVRSAGATAQAAESLTERYGGTLQATLTETMRGFTVRNLSAKGARQLAAHPDVAEVRQSGRAGIGGPGGTQSNPRNWGLDRIDQRDRPLDSKYTYRNDGAGATVYIVDTGIRFSHQEFGGRAKNGVDLHAQPNGGNDCHKHGSHVAGIVGGSTRGVAKKVNLVSVRVLGCDGFGEDIDVANAAEWIAANGVPNSVANLSVYTDDPDVAAPAIKGSIAKGYQWSLITGNNGGNACNYGPGGQVPEALQVANATSSDTRAGDSNSGSCMDLFAPGSNIDSAFHSSDTAYGTLSGTSMAAPHVAGAMALRISEAPNQTPKQLHDYIMGEASTGKMSGISSDTPNKLLYANPQGTSSGEPRAAFEASCPSGGLKCSFDASGSSDPDGSIASYKWSFGDSTSGDGRTTDHTYGAAGSYKVTLTVTDNEGKTNSTERTVNVGSTGGQNPTASFASPQCQGLSCSFNASASKDPDGSIASYAWDFGDGTKGSGVTTNHTFPSKQATYTVTLTVTDNSGNTGTTSRKVQCFSFGTGQGFCFPG
ncbi:PKD domain-containing protein [Spirillospora sp. CA-294931]|uniref:PKD domain-containing protein n=1 Tax=Spirillospora sp. CA-294931 TaxID=3240042 RepID=UPI003D8E092C